MPLVESFSVDHTKMRAPAIRFAKELITPHGDVISVYDLRFYRPNIDMMSETGAHSLEHLLADFMRISIDKNDVKLIDISPMGCRTGFYMSIIGKLSNEKVLEALLYSMKSILELKDSNVSIPAANINQCGSYKMHSMGEAKKIARHILNSKVVLV